MAAPMTLSATVGASPQKVFEALSEADDVASFGPTKVEMRADELNPGRDATWTCVNDFPMDPRCWDGTTVN